MSRELTKGCVVFMKASSGLAGYGNAQCISEVHHESLGTISLYGHNQHYKTYDIDKVVEYPTEHADLQAENKRLEAENRALHRDIQKMNEMLAATTPKAKEAEDGKV